MKSGDNPVVDNLDFDVERVRTDFPLLRQQVNGKPLVYLDNGATSQKPQCVIDELVRYYTTENANVHRGVHTLSQLATDDYEGARSKVRRFLNAGDDREIIYTRGATEGINLVAQTFGRQKRRAGRRDRRLQHGAPLQHRPLADAV